VEPGANVLGSKGGVSLGRGSMIRITSFGWGSCRGGARDGKKERASKKNQKGKGKEILKDARS